MTHVPPRSPAVFYGSSTIKMWTTLGGDLGSPRVVNLGFGGSTLEACVSFFERLVPPLRPSSLVVYAGDNDLGDGRSPQQVAGWFGELIAKVDRDLKDVPFGFLSIKPSPARLRLLPQISTANEAIRREIRRHPAAFYVDVFARMLGPNGQPVPELFLDDGLHLSRSGYRLWDIYFQTPSHFIPNLTAPHLLDGLRRLEITLAVGEMDPFCENTRHLSASLWDKSIPNRMDLWSGEAHRARDWRQMVRAYL